MTLGGPTAAGWVALIGTTELRELTGKVPWYGTLANHAGLVLPVVIGGVVYSAANSAVNGTATPFGEFLAAMLGAACVSSC